MKERIHSVVRLGYARLWIIAFVVLPSIPADNPTTFSDVWGG